MVTRIRDSALALACVRYGLPWFHAPGVDQLPTEVTAPLEAALIGHLHSDGILRAFRAAMDGLLVVAHTGPFLQGGQNGPA
jgi:hypothetical protein